MSIECIFFDVGETLIDETRSWRGWARYLGVPDQDWFAALDEVIAAGQHHRAVFERFRPGFDLAAAERARTAAGDRDMFDVTDLYPDAAPCLDALRAAGYVTGVAGNAPPEGAFLSALHTDLVTSAVELGAEKPSTLFFERLADFAGRPPGHIAYVGDRLDNDILPARTAGMTAVFVERGPWGRAHAKRSEIATAHVHIASLAELPSRLRGL